MVDLRFSLHLNDENRTSFRLDGPEVEGYIIGRSDSQASPPPDVDLAMFNARELGVSRRHAAIVKHLEDLYLIDLDSVNGTYINGRKLPADAPCLLNDGDQIMLGDLVMRLTRQM
jgi:pSer/pThr/pTyr-binding forkhead associated (FHA) protein